MAKKSSSTTKQPQSNYSGTLHRSDINKVIGGVCGGLGEYLEIDPTIVRIVFILITLFGGSGILIYIILWVIIPAETNIKAGGQKTIQNNIKEVEQRAQEIIRVNGPKDSRLVLGILIVAVGLIFLAETLLGIQMLGFDKIWPLILVAFGILILIKNVKK